MNLELARKIERTLNFPEILSVLEEYVADKIAKHHRLLEELQDPEDIYKTQGKIAAFRDLLKIREHALAVLNNKER